MNSLELAVYAASISVCVIRAIDNHERGNIGLSMLNVALVGFLVGIVFALCVLRRG